MKELLEFLQEPRTFLEIRRRFYPTKWDGTVLVPAEQSACDAVEVMRVSSVLRDALSKGILSGALVRATRVDGYVTYSTSEYGMKIIQDGGMARAF